MTSRGSLPSIPDIGERTLVTEDRLERRIDTIEAAVEVRFSALEARITKLEADFGRPADEVNGLAPTGMRKLFGELRGEMVALRGSITDLGAEIRADKAERVREREASTAAAKEASEALAKRRAPWERIGWAALLAVVTLAAGGAAVLAWQSIMRHVH